MAIKFDKQKIKEIHAFLTSSYIPVDGIKRDRELENSIILKNKVNFKLMVNLCNGIIDEWKKLHNKFGFTELKVVRAGIYEFKYTNFVKEGIVASSFPKYTLKEKARDTLDFGNIYQDIHTQKHRPFNPLAGISVNVTQDHTNICNPSIENNGAFGKFCGSSLRLTDLKKVGIRPLRTH